MSADDILYEVKDYVATITINRPKVLNACTGDNFDAIGHLIDQAGADRRVGVIVLTGVGERSFCAGGDVNWEKGGNASQSTKTFEEHEYNLDKIIAECPRPIIARVNGYAIGGGNHLQYFCDLTIAAEHAIFGQNGPRVGSPAGGRVVAHLANILGHKRAREMWMLARRYSAQQALDWGLINSVVPMAKLDQEVKKWTDELLALSPTCLKILKRSFYCQMQPLMHHTVESLVAEIAPDYYSTGEQQEGAAAFLEKRKPDFNRWR
jgi:2-ketocyclohexanecarboxyl-CoA hydrolase